MCPTELTAYSDKIKEFEKLDAQVLGVSVDSQYAHLQWNRQPRKEGEHTDSGRNGWVIQVAAAQDVWGITRSTVFIASCVCQVERKRYILLRHRCAECMARKQ